MNCQSFNHRFTKPIAGLLVGLLTASSLTACSGSMLSASPQSSSSSATAPLPSTESNLACSELSTPLSEQEREFAAVAWQYFVNNRQPETGFTNAAHQFPSGTLWDQGNYLMALNAAVWLKLIDQAEFDAQLNQFLTSLGEIPLVDDALPNKVYNSATGEMVNYDNEPTSEGLGWSALDIGRLLTALHIVRTCHPQYDDWISGIVAGWQVARSVEAGQLYGATVEPDGKIVRLQEGRLGYEEYAARGYALWGFDVTEALSLEPMKRVNISGVEIPVDTRDYDSTNANNYVVSESYILEAIEFGWDTELASYAEAVLQAQENRYEKTGQLTAVSEDNIDQAPHFLYNTVYANDQPWAVITEKNEPYPALRTVSTKAAFGWYYLFPEKPYTLKLIDLAEDLQSHNKDGFYAGIYEETEDINTILTGNTNGLILEILYYKALGGKPILEVASKQR